jgi:ATP-dependent DNA helicase RecQ
MVKLSFKPDYLKSIAFFDLETNHKEKQILDIGCIRSDEVEYHKNNPTAFLEFVKSSDYLCGHNIISHDLIFLQKYLANPIFGLDKTIDTLLLSPLLFPKNPYHSLLKDDKLQTDELNNPLNDSKKAKDLFFDEVNAFSELSQQFKVILYSLLEEVVGFACFFKYLDFIETADTELLEILIRSYFKDEICSNCDVKSMISQRPVAVAYALALLNSNDRYSITPAWVLKNYPDVESILFLLRNNRCNTGCEYCNEALNSSKALKRYFGFDAFRSYDNETLQENAINATIHHKSILAIFPTGGGKSITFQLPALMSGENAKALTVVISPLQSLMKDQVDNLEKKGITEAVTINGLLDPIERSKSIERVENGHASLLYISPESLRSVTIERLLLKRKIARFVIDEAHCFSSWGQDFRVDYLYIGDFIKNLQAKKNMDDPIPVSCFTATAKPKVIEDIKTYFKEKLNLDLEVFRARVSRTNLHYQVFQKDNEEDKYTQLRSILESKDCPAIVYVSRTRRAYKLAERLNEDGFNAKPYHGKMDKVEKTINQNEFMNGAVNIMVATSAFGMGVDKSDVGAVIHYDISDSLENYIQEAGRAGRDENIKADCYVLFNEEDLDKHFILLNQTKISNKEINQVWRAIKDLTRTRAKTSNSALEIARKAGWDESVIEIETRVTTAIAALEDAGYMKRGQNNPRIYANSILSKSSQEAIDKINGSALFDEKQKVKAIRIIKKLFSSKSKRLSTEEQAESRVDYIAEQLGLVKDDVIRIVELLRQDKILAQTKDLTAFIKKSENANRSLIIVEGFRKMESFLLTLLKEEEATYHIKEINEKLIESGIKDSSPNKIKTIINFWAIKHWVKRHNLEYSRHHIKIALINSKKEFDEKLKTRHFLAKVVTEYLYKKSAELNPTNVADEVLIEFSVQELKEMIEKVQGMFAMKISIDDIEDTLFYLSRIEALKIEGGFMVVQNNLSFERLEKNNAKQYTLADYEKLNQFYLQRVQQIHIVGEYAKKMIKNYKEALQFVDDYFVLNYTSFLRKYFPGSRQDEIKRTLTPEKFEKLFGSLSPSQLEIIKDSQNKNIVIAAGPGSGKTRVLVHKLASLLLTEDVKHEQLLMLTFSRAAATEFKKRLLDLIGNAANFIEIKTFHSYCFDLMGRMGNLSSSDKVLETAIEKIKINEIEKSRITKTVLVVDEAQDMNSDEYKLVNVLMEQNEDLRVILVGDDDQNIYGFRGADSKYMQQLITEKAAKKYELVENYRSKNNIVTFVNQWAERINNRLKVLPGFAVSSENGNIEIIQYNSTKLIIPLADSIEQASLSGSTCILTKTNEEAIQLTGLLVHRGMHAKLIQSNDSFNLSDLYELRYFSTLVMKNPTSPLISDEEWEKAKSQISLHNQHSTKLEIISIIIKQFELTNPVKKYKSDWKAFLTESKLDDFVKIDNETIFVSTIHKAKGKEFDNVYVLLNGFRPDSDEEKRQLYVAFTRAKTNLTIHYNGVYLQSQDAKNLYHRKNEMIYDEPLQIALLLNHKNVQLGYFEFVQHRINSLQSGTTLKILEDGLGNSDGELVLKYSKTFKDSLAEYLHKGYKPNAAKVNFKVYWKSSEDEKAKEVLIILPELVLIK